MHLPLLIAAILSLPSPVARGSVDSTSVIISLTDGKSGYICSGSVIVSTGTHELILSARHCLVDGKATPTTVRFFDGDEATIEYIAVSDDQDLMLVSTHSKRNHPAAELTLTQPRRGDSITIVGAPDGTMWGLISGYVMASSKHIVYPPETADAIPVACVGCDGGMSGGGVRDSDGRVVGVMVASNQASTIGYYIPASTVFDFLKQVLTVEK